MDWFERVPRQYRGPHADPSATAGPLGRGGAGVTVEEIEEVWTYCTAAAFREHKPGLVHLAEWVATEGGQEAIAILVDGGMELVVGKETS